MKEADLSTVTDGNDLSISKNDFKAFITLNLYLL